jgi:NAD(P)-dependent dehydrogenase (short-subunit alcohol dehydrogenase family)
MRLEGKEIVITGATDGIGKVTARELAKMGASVTIVARDPTKAQQVIKELRTAVGHDRIGFVRADLSSQKSVRGAAETIKGRLKRIDVLINNAGAMFTKRELTEDGIERTFALNHLGYFLFTHLLLDMLKASAPSRIINVASAAHNGVKLDINDLQGEKSYSGWRAYQRSKLANIYFSYELARRLAGSNVTVNCLHPGFVASSFGNNNSGIARAVLTVAKNLFAISEANGARTSVYLASSPDVDSTTGKYFDSRRAVKSSPASMDEQKWRELWRASEKLTGLS